VRKTHSSSTLPYPPIDAIEQKEVVEHTYSGRVAGAVTARSDDGTIAQGVTKKSRNKI